MNLAKRQLSKSTSSTYILAKDEGQYSIICIEENGSETQIYKAPKITADKKEATRIFKRIALGKVFGATLIDVIYNLIN